MTDQAAPATFAQPWQPRDDVRITDVQAIVTAPEGIPPRSWS